jgi:hypothetical protein
MGGVGFGVWNAWWNLDRMLHRPPTTADIWGRFPEVEVPKVRFQGVWSDWDSGAWIFDYHDVHTRDIDAYYWQTLRASGWSLKDNTGVEVMYEKPGLHLRYRPLDGGGLRLVIVGGAERQGIKSIVTDEASRKYLRRVVEPHWGWPMTYPDPYPE